MTFAEAVAELFSGRPVRRAWWGQNLAWLEADTMTLKVVMIRDPRVSQDGMARSRRSVVWEPQSFDREATDWEVCDPWPEVIEHWKGHWNTVEECRKTAVRSIEAQDHG